MTDSEAYSIITKFQRCLTSPIDSCIVADGCEDCTYYVNPNTKLNQALNYVLTLLKDRNPELYFASSLDKLRGDMNEYTSNR